ncbi:MAG: hypothetical protein ABUK11_00555 [Mariprofundaceae bacterium]
MKNKITVTLPFSFRGKAFNPKCVIDLDEHMELLGSIPCLYTHLANENDISVYSYEHDVMMMGTLVFEQAEGIAAEFTSNGHFDSDGFKTKWLEYKLHEWLEEIAMRHMGVDNLEEQSPLKKALLEAHQLGVSNPKSELKFTVPSRNAFD